MTISLNTLELIWQTPRSLFYKILRERPLVDILPSVNGKNCQKWIIREEDNMMEVSLVFLGVVLCRSELGDGPTNKELKAQFCR